MPHPQTTRRHDLLTWLILAGLALAVFIYVAFFMPRAAGGPIGRQHPSVGKLLGDLTLEPLTGAASQITNPDLAGKVVLLDYWGPRCPPCKRELPELVAVAEQFKNRPDFLFLPVSCPIGDSDEELDHLQGDTEAFLSHIRATPPTYQLSEASLKLMESPAVGEMYQFALPTTVVIDRQGIIRGKWQGYRDGYERQIADLLAELLGNEKP